MTIEFVNETPLPVQVTAAGIPNGSAFLHSSGLFGKTSDGVDAINLLNGMDRNPISNFGADPVIQIDLTKIVGHAHI